MSKEITITAVYDERFMGRCCLGRLHGPNQNDDKRRLVVSSGKEPAHAVMKGYCLTEPGAG